MRHFQGEDIIIWWAVRSCSHPSKISCWTTHSQKATMKDWKRLWMHKFIYVHSIIYIYRYVWFILLAYFLYVMIMYYNTCSDVYTLIRMHTCHTSFLKIHLYTSYITHIYTHILVWLKVFPSIGWMIGMHPIFLANSSSHHGIFLSRKCMWMSLMLGFASTNVWYSHRTGRLFEFFTRMPEGLVDGSDAVDLDDANLQLFFGV